MALPRFGIDVELLAVPVSSFAGADECGFQCHDENCFVFLFKAPSAELPVRPAGRRRNAESRGRRLASFLSPADTAIRGNRAEGSERRFPAREIAAPIGPLAVRRVVYRRRPQKPGSLLLIEA